MPDYSRGPMAIMQARQKIEAIGLSNLLPELCDLHSAILELFEEIDRLAPKIEQQQVRAALLQSPKYQHPHNRADRQANGQSSIDPNRNAAASSAILPEEGTAALSRWTGDA